MTFMYDARSTFIQLHADTSQTVRIIQLTRYAFLDKNYDARSCVLAQEESMSRV
jgi:hypothetical protein